MAERDRRRVLQTVDSRSIGGLLVDGFGRGVWRMEREGASTVLRIETFAPLVAADASAVKEEGDRLVWFLAPQAERRRVEFGPVL